MKPVILERDEMSEFERNLFLNDAQRVIEEYFELDGKPSLELTRTQEGFLVCVIISARRIKSVKRPQ